MYDWWAYRSLDIDKATWTTEFYNIKMTSRMVNVFRPSCVVIEKLPYQPVQIYPPLKHKHKDVAAHAPPEEESDIEHDADENEDPCLDIPSSDEEAEDIPEECRTNRNLNQNLT